MAMIAFRSIVALLAITSTRSLKESDGIVRAVGGSPATRGRYSYFVDLVVTPVSGSSFICGGALIHSDIVLTAAQCHREGATISVRVDASTQTDGIKRTAQRIVPHPRYESSFDYDIMVLKLNAGVTIQPVRYNTLATVPTASQVLTIFGFGASSEINFTPSEKLMETDVFAADFGQCNKQYQLLLDQSLHVCAIGPPEGGKDACDGDGGAPLIIPGQSAATDIVVGIVSFGAGCARANSYSGYSSTAGYADWIKGQICALSADVPDDCPQNNVGCFSGSALVDIFGRGPTRLSDLKINDKVKVDVEKYEPVYSFGHYSPNSQAEFLQISTSKSTVEVSKDHMLFVRNNQYAIPASMIRVGDEVLDGTGSVMLVTSVKATMAEGVFAPFTPSGTIVVNDILASAYVAFEDSASIKIGGMHFSYHWMAHKFEFPHRLYCHYLKTCPNEMYAANGVSLWVEKPHTWALQLLRQQSIFRTTGMIIFLTALFFFEVLEHWWALLFWFSVVRLFWRTCSGSRVKTL